MAKGDWEIPANLQPDPRDYRFDLERALSAVVGIEVLRPGRMPSPPARWAPSGPAAAW